MEALAEERRQLRGLGVAKSSLQGGHQPERGSAYQIAAAFALAFAITSCKWPLWRHLARSSPARTFSRIIAKSKPRS